MLGSQSETDDAVQNAWLRISRADVSGVENLGGWLTTVVARVCLNMLRARKSRREELLAGVNAGPLPSGLGEVDQPGHDPEAEVVMAESVGVAMLVVLDTLTPPERLTFVLHDMFGVPFDEIGPMVERSPAAARQLASRARRRVSGTAHDPQPDVHVELTGEASWAASTGSAPARSADPARHRQVVEAFFAAARGGDFDALVAVLDPEVVLRADRQAGPTPAPVVLHGATTVAKGARLASERARSSQPALVNGAIGLVMASRGRLVLAMSFTVAGDRITEIDVIADPDRLRQLDLAVLDH